MACSGVNCALSYHSNIFHPPFPLSIVGVSLTPTSNQVIPMTSFDNVTYDCMISGNRVLFWEVNNVQIQSHQRIQFEGIGVFVEDQATNRSTLIITRQAWQAYSHEPISVRCSAFTSIIPDIDFSNFSVIITYGKEADVRNMGLLFIKMYVCIVGFHALKFN